MLRTKKDIDKHVRSTLSKLREDERNLRGYRIAGLYYNIEEYSLALEYIQRYLQVNDKNPSAYKILGQCYEKLKRPDKQLHAYQRSLELDKKQTDLLIEVCKLLQNHELSDVTPAKAKYWYELAESRNIHDSAVLNLKLKFTNDGDQAGVQDIILKEIVRRPLDIGLRIRLIYHFLDQNRVDDAFKYTSEMESKPQNIKFQNSKDWISTVLVVLEKYKAKNMASLNKNWPYWLHLITTIERQLFLTLAHSPKDSNAIDHNLLEATNLLFELDQNLNKVVACSFLDSERDLVSEFLSHFRGQLSLHAASLLFKRETEQLLRGNWHEITKNALPLLLLAFNFGAIDGNQLWLRNASEVIKKLIGQWQVQSSFRVIQAARTLQSCINTNNSSDTAVLANLRKICNDKYNVWSNHDDILNEIRSIVADSDWRKKIYRNLFVSKEHQNAASTSYFIKSRAFESPTFEWPDANNLTALEIKAQEVDASSLGHLVYLALGSDNQSRSQITVDPDFSCVLFKNLNYSSSNLMNSSAETLNQLDINTFLYATTLQTKRNINMENTMLADTSGTEPNKPKVLPYVNMASILTTEDQSEWWTTSYKIYHNIAGEELASLRATLQYGIEAARGVGTPKMDLIILLKLGKILSEKAEQTSKAVERGFLEERYEALFKFALYMLRMQNSSRSNDQAYRRLFKYAVGNNSYEIEQEINKLAEEAITGLTTRYFKKSAYEECIEDLAGIKLPFATYFQAESYRKLTEMSDTPKKNKRIYLEKAKDCLKQTVDLLEGPNIDKNHPLKSLIDEDIKRVHNETRKLETTQSLSDSFVSANGRSDLDESVHRFDRSIDTATPIPHNNYDNLERMIRQMMETLNLVKEDVAEVRSRVQSIEEQINKDDEDVEILDDYYLDNDYHRQNVNLDNTSMIANVSRNQTFNQQTPKTAQIPRNNTQLNARNTPPSIYQHQSPMTLNNSYNMNPLLNNMYSQLSMNPYQAALVNATGQNYGQQQQLAGNFQPSPILPYGNEVYTLQQQLLAQQLASDVRSPGLMGLLQQQSVQPPQPTLNHPLSNPLVSTGLTTVQPAISNVNSSLDQSNVSITQTPPQKQWNTLIKNTPVEKAPPVNVVITSSDPVPQNLTSTATQAPTNFSVTIPPQHIKNNPAVPHIGTALANPTITAALQNKMQQTPSQSKETSKVVVSTVATPTTQEQKSIFGNLSKPTSSTPFSSPGSKLTPELKKTETPKTDASKPSPFASFSFGVQSTNAPTTTSQSKPLFSFGNIGQSTSSSTTTNQSKPLFSFSNIGQSLNKSETSVLGATSTPEAPSQNETAANTSSNLTKEDEDNYEPTAHFEPVIPLPDLVEVKTGEENETIHFEHRAKLLRYVKESKEWKERGIGNMKVMSNKDDPNKVRLLMRREQVLKICCNQFIDKDTKFNKMPNTETALTWFGQDYSENELQVEMLAIRFKTAEICKQFHDAILKAQTKMTNGKSNPVTTTTKADEKPANKNEAKGFGDQFKPKPGVWSCKACYTSNTPDAKHCACCEEPKDDTVPKKEKPSIFGSSNAGAPKFSFGNLSSAATTSKPAESIVSKTTAVKPAEKGFGEQFKPKPGSWSCKSCYTSNTAEALHCACCEEPKDDTVPKKEKPSIFGSSNVGASTFSFGNLSAVGDKKAADTSSSASKFGSSTFGFTFGAQNNTTTTPSLKPTEAVVPKLDSKEFSFVFKGKSPGKQQPVTENEGIEDVSDDENVEEEENTAYFAPVIPLPDKVDVRTGEEDEDVLYSHRAKLYRFRDKEWRERGLGDIKILRHKQNGQLRVVMRREQIHKICLNHVLTSDIEYKTKDAKSWQFFANDFSEGKYEADNFSVRFKTDEIALEFKKAIDDALGGTSTPIVNGNADDQPDTGSNATGEENKIIQDLQLPTNFFEYKTLADCSGCRGCNSDDHVFPVVKDTNIVQIDNNPLPLVAPPKVEIAHNDLSKDNKKTDKSSTFSFTSFGNDSKTNGFSFGTNANNTQNTGMFFGSSNFKSPFTPGNENKDTTNIQTPGSGQKSLFGGNVTKTPSAEPVKAAPAFSFNSANVFGSNTEEKSPFSFTPATSKPQENSTESKPLFGNTPTFGAAVNLKTPITNIFGGNVNGTNEKESKETPSTRFSFKLPPSTTVTPITAIDSPSLHQPIQTSTPIIEAPITTPSMFSNAGGMSFADLAKNTSSNNTTEPFATSNNLSFSNLTQNTTNGTPSFGNSSTNSGFFGLSNRDTFSNLMQPPVNGNGTNTPGKDDDNENHTDDANYDPHYEPIIALPDEIQVSTGEENEEKLFGERAKLYRYDSDSKQWKERGVGEFKILHHTANHSYRLLLRREQIHKLVLNMALNADLQINPMKQNDKAFIWVGQNFAEEQQNGELESLSVRFKNADLASKFNECLQKCFEKIKAQ